MKHNKFDWSSGSPPVIEAHSLRKLEVYREYLMHYLQVLNRNPLIPRFGLSIVDGFSGGGSYVFKEGVQETIVDGSPLVILDAIELAEFKVHENRSGQGVKKQITLDIDYHFVDKSLIATDHLTQLIHQSRFSHKLKNSIQIYNGEFISVLPAIISKILAHKEKSKRRAIFILDQCGYSAVPFHSIQNIFSILPNSEIILTFATDWLIEYLSDNEKFKNILKKIGISDEHEINRIIGVKRESKEWRKLVQLALHDIIPKRTNAKFYTPFFIKSKTANRSFWLVHLSNHPKARDVMTELHHEFKNSFEHYTSAGAMMFGYDPINDRQVTKKDDIFKDDVCFNFDDYSRNIMNEQLSTELPSLLREYQNEISFKELYLKIVNTTPAAKYHIKQVCSKLAKTKEISIRNGNSVRTAAKSIQDEDRIFIPAQFNLPFFKN